MKKFEIKKADKEKWLYPTTSTPNSPAGLKIKDLLTKGPSQDFLILQMTQKKYSYYREWKNGSKSITKKK